MGIGDTFFRNLQGRFYTEGDLIRTDIDLDRLQTGSIVADNLSLDAVADSTVIDVSARFNNEGTQTNRAELNARVSFPDLETEGYKLRVDLQPSEIVLADHAWDIQPATLRYR